MLVAELCKIRVAELQPEVPIFPGRSIEVSHIMLGFFEFVDKEKKILFLKKLSTR